MHFAGVFLALTAFSTLSIAGNGDMTTFCNNFYMQGNSLVGTCKLQNGSTVQASVDLNKCIEVNPTTYEISMHPQVRDLRLVSHHSPSVLNVAEEIIAWRIVVVFHTTSTRVTSVFNAGV